LFERNGAIARVERVPDSPTPDW